MDFLHFRVIITSSNLNFTWDDYLLRNFDHPAIFEQVRRDNSPAQLLRDLACERKTAQIIAKNMLELTTEKELPFWQQFYNLVKE